MAKSAKVQDIEALKHFRIAMLNFADKTTSAIGEADAEVQRVTSWLEHEASAHWTSETRKRHTIVMKAREALRDKQLFKSPTGGKQSTVDEEKALSIALRRLEEAEQKMANVKKWIRQLHKESHAYRGSVQRLATSVSTDVPNTAAKIMRMITALEGYAALSAPDFGHAMAGGDGSAMSRGSSIPEAGGGYKRLRQVTPAGPAKDAAPDSASAVAWSAGEFLPNDAQTLKTLSGIREPIDPSCAVILAAGVQTAQRIYLERCERAFPGDSGWYIGSADGAPPAALEAVKIDQLLRDRPHFANLFSMPPGTLVVVDTAGIAAILNSEDEDIWPG